MSSRIALACVSALAATLMLPAAAAAGQSAATAAGGYLDIGPGSFGDQQRHEITVSYTAGVYRATDSAGVVAAAGCSQVDPTTVSCPDEGVDSVVPFGAAAADTITVESLGPGDRSGIHGFGGNDRLVGSPADDFVVGYVGDDTLFGNGGADTMLGGPGGDGGENGSDVLDGGPGPDYISGDSSTGGNSIDTVSYGNRGAGESVSVTLGVGDGDDGGAADGSPGNRDTVEYVENVIGGAGDDIIRGSQVLQGNNDNYANEFFGGGGADLLLGDEGTDDLHGGSGADRIFGGSQQDRLTGDGGADFMKGEGQKDHLFARDGQRDRRLDCGPGGRKESASRDPVDPRPISC